MTHPRHSLLLCFGRPAPPGTRVLSSAPLREPSPGSPSRVVGRVRVPAFLCRGRAGLSTCCPSATASALALGPDLPREDQLYPGTLGYSACKILTYISLLVPAFSLHKSPHALPFVLPPFVNAPLPMISDHSMASAARFSPGHFRRRASRLVSCYALFERVAASEPTS